MNINKKKLGQFYTPKNIVKKMINLSNKKSLDKVLEPSAGIGNFSLELEKKFKNVLSIEKDGNNIYKNAINEDFFNFNFQDEKFDLIIGNPPYVKHQDISEDTKKYISNNPLLNKFNKNTNLYCFFIKYCIDLLKPNGELIFIVPKDFINSNSSKMLNKYIYKNGTITFFEDLTDKNIFSDADAEVSIFKFVKNNFDRKMEDGRFFVEKNGLLFFVSNKYNKFFSDFFYVKVGGVSGADSIFSHYKGNIEVVYSKTKKTNQTKKMYKDILNNYILNNKEKLYKRKSFAINENN